jgi:hypothetical protein
VIPAGDFTMGSSASEQAADRSLMNRRGILFRFDRSRWESTM